MELTDEKYKELLEEWNGKKFEGVIYHNLEEMEAAGFVVEHPMMPNESS